MASILKSLVPTRVPHRFEYVGTARLLGSITVNKPEGVSRIIGVLGVSPVVVPGGTPAAEINKLTEISYQVANDGQSVTFYGWKPTAAGDTTRVASTADADFEFTLLCEMQERS